MMSTGLKMFVLFMAAFAIMIVSAPAFIPLLRRLKFGQTIRQEGPESHLVKNGTPTMGGIMIIVAFCIPAAFIIGKYEEAIAPCAMTLLFGIVGFLDDFIKVKKKSSGGLKAWQKMGLQILFTGLVIAYMYWFSDISLAIKIPFAYGMEFNLGWLVIPFDFLVIIGTDNGANFTDGLDGLLSKVTLVILGFLLLVAFKEISGLIYPIIIMMGALLGFLVFNCHPAKVFMGDTGSLAIGGFVALCAIELKVPVFLLIIAFVYVAEVGSVMLQVSYFKLTHGKRIFKMAPIHHHFETSGWKETKVVSIFTIATAILCAIGVIALYV